MRSFKNGLIRPIRQGNSSTKVFRKLYTGKEETILNNIRQGQYIYSNVPVLIDDGGLGQVLPSIYMAISESDLMATVNGSLKTYGDSTRYIGYVSHRALGWENHFLYSFGNEYLEITGGYVQGLTTYSAWTLTKEFDHLSIYIYRGGTTASYRTASTIDLSNVSYLYFDWEAEAYGPETTRSAIYVTTDAEGVNKAAQYLSNIDTHGFSKIVERLDVSNLEGNYYIQINSYGGGTTGLDNRKRDTRLYRLGIA